MEKQSVRHAIFAKFPDPNGPPRGSRNQDPKSNDQLESNASSSLNGEEERKLHARDGDREGSQSTTSNPDSAKASKAESLDRKMERTRAIFIVLETEAQVFFLAGTSYIVDLPFRVSATFATPYGVVMQREISKKTATLPTPQLPSAPFNSFSLSQLESFTHKSNVNQSQSLGTFTSSIKPAFRSMFPKSSNTIAQAMDDEDLPGHVYLRDPLADLDVLSMLDEPNEVPKLPKKTRPFPKRTLDLQETILYMSAGNELRDLKPFGETSSELLLAVSINQTTSKFNIWSVSEVASQKLKRPRRYSHSGFASRRQSSFGGTGANTPALRTSMGPRESFGGHNDPKQDQEEEANLASQLDPAFEQPGANARSSRRISSMLARSELSTNRDPSAYDVPGGHATGTIRRGQPLGVNVARNSFGHAPLHGTSRGHAGVGPETYDVDALGLPDLQIDGISEKTGSNETAKLRRRSHPWPFENSPSDVAVKRIRSIPAAASLPKSEVSMQSLSAKFEVFTLTPPQSTEQALREVVLCVLDRDNRQLSVLHVAATQPHYEGNSDDPFIRIKDVGTGDGIIDACKLTDGTTSRLVVLSETIDGRGELTLQSLWSTSYRFHPPCLLMRDPYRVDHQPPQLRKQDGGLKRVLSQGIDSLEAIKPSSGSSQLDLRDSRGIWHRVEIRLNPENTIVKQAIRLCDTALPAAGTEREPILRIWWDVMFWLSTRLENPEPLEWTAFVVVMFSLFAVLLEENQKPLRTRRKAGLLRSSSGAQSELGSFEEMMSIESLAGSTPNTWLQEPCWSSLCSEGPPSSGERRSGRSSASSLSTESCLTKKVSFIPDCLNLAREFVKTPSGQEASGERGFLPTARRVKTDARMQSLAMLLKVLHLLCEEQKLNVLASDTVHSMTPILAQMGGWLGWENWSWKSSYYMLSNASMDRWIFDESIIDGIGPLQLEQDPPSILGFIEKFYQGSHRAAFPTLKDMVPLYDSSRISRSSLEELTPKTTLLLDILASRDMQTSSYVKELDRLGLDSLVLDSFPEAVAAPLRAVIAASQASPASDLSPSVLTMIDRLDLIMLDQSQHFCKQLSKEDDLPSHDSLRDYHAICNSALDVDHIGSSGGSAQMDRQSTTRLIFKDDQRFSEAIKLVDPLKPPAVRCMPEPEWTDTDLLESQQDLVKVVATRTLSVSPGRGMLFYSAHFPLLTEKFSVHGFSLGCVMKPSNTTVTADKSLFLEEKVSWAFFHAGVEAGLSISKGAKGIDTSWILYNKPPELTNRHAGFLLALGLNGHLKSIAKWVAFKYLTPKHTMTSIGLLLGLAASYLGTMDILVTRLLSVHVTRMLPPGAAELNISPLTQTAGIMAIGLLYCNTQHRRMSEIMLSEMENIDEDDDTNPNDYLRDERYRLAAGFALGYINLGQGRNLKGLHDMHIVERLLALAVATKQVNLVHILDKATAAATIALTLIFMKTEDVALARKIDVPDTIHQFDYVRPDIFLLRTVARHLIMWNGITPTLSWMRSQLPPSYQSRIKLGSVQALRTEDLAIFNIIAGLCVSIGLRFAGSARQDVRDLLGHFLDQFIRICRLPALNYDGKLTRITVRNCQDAVALAAASVMAGTGDIYLFRRLRALHGRTDAHTPYGSHLATHQAIGALFLGGGTHTFNTSNIAVASLLCAFYPLYPMQVLDNKCHLQAFRHFWVLATEPRCLIVRDVETHRPITLPVVIALRSGEELEATAPCLLPELDKVASVYSNDPKVWQVTLDFAGNPGHLLAFKRHQSMFVRRRDAYDVNSSVFSATMQALSDAQVSHQLNRQIFEWIFELPSFASFTPAERALALPTEGTTLLRTSASKNTVLDDRLSLERNCLESDKAERLWNLRVLFAWAENAWKPGSELGWLGKEVVEGLKAKIMLRWKDEYGDGGSGTR